MSEIGSLEGGGTPPVALLQMMTGYWVSQAIYVAAKVGVADHLTNGPRPVAELAEATKTDGTSLRRAAARAGQRRRIHGGPARRLRAHAAVRIAALGRTRLDALPRHYVQRGAVPRVE